MLVTDAGQMIRMKVDGIRFTGRGAQGVTLFRVAEDEHIVSVALLKQDQEEETDEDIIEGVAAEENEGGAVTTEIPEQIPTVE